MQQQFELATAIITPFTPDQEVDFSALERLAQHLIDTGSDAIVVNGSTGESPTTTESEKFEILKCVKSVIGNQPVKLIAGTGTNATRTTLALSEKAANLGVDALLVVIPYYNKPSQQGMLAHFGTVAKAIEAPIIIYNIPGRSVVNMLPDTMATLAMDYPQIIGVKQSNPDMDQVSEIRLKAPASFQIWSGDDSLTLPMMALGASGVVSVAAHVVGLAMRDMIQAYKANQREKALALHLKLLEIYRGLFFLPNPTVVKACLAKMGLVHETLRLPLTPMTPQDLPKLDQLMAAIQAVAPQSASLV